MTSIAIVESFWLQSSNHATKQPLQLKEGKNFIGSAEFCIFEIQELPKGQAFVSIICEENKVMLRCISAATPVRVGGKLMEAGEKIALGEKLDFVVGKYMFQFFRKFARVENELTISQMAKLENFSNKGSKNPLNKLELIRLVIKKVQEQINFSAIQMNQLKSPETVAGIKAKLTTVMANLGIYNDESLNVAELEKQVMDELIGLGPLESLLADPSITEIMVNSPTQVFTEKGGKLVLSNVAFSSEQALLAVIERIVSQVNRRIDASSPIVDARLLDGSRVNAVIPPIALKGPSLTIRRFSKKPISVDQLVEWKSVSNFTAKFLKLSVESHLNMVISGGTGSGKTTLLNALSGFIPAHERIVTVEDAAELQLQQPHVVSLESRPANMEGKGAITIRDLVKNCLRMRPDRIVVGECRGGEALDMLQAMNTGHDGSLTTAHANTPEDMLRRLETMVLMAGVDFPLRAIREQVASAVHAIVQQTRMPSGRRLVTAYTWIHGLDRDAGTYQTYPMVEFVEAEGSDQGKLHYNISTIKKFAKHYNFLNAAEELIEASKEEFSKGTIS